MSWTGFGHPIPIFHFFPGPRSLSEKLETELMLGLWVKHRMRMSFHFLPTVNGHQFVKHHCQRDAVQGIL